MVEKKGERYLKRENGAEKWGNGESVRVVRVMRMIEKK